MFECAPRAPLRVQYSSNGISGIEQIIISSTDPVFQQYCSDSSKPCVASIAVFGFTASRYSIVAATGAVTLVDGQPQSGSVGVCTCAAPPCTDVRHPVPAQSRTRAMSAHVNV
ncbi:hypothetical protein EON67_11825, partial [archaeon]